MRRKASGGDGAKASQGEAMIAAAHDMLKALRKIEFDGPPSPRRLGHDEVSRDGGELCSGASYGVSFGCMLAWRQSS
jgi:hypothetical protein